MFLRVISALLLTSLACAAPPIPERISVGAYSVGLKCDREWSAQVSPSKGVIVYSYDDHFRDKISFQISVYRVAVPSDVAQLPGAEAADRLVYRDGLKFKTPIFRKNIGLPKKPDEVSVPAGTAFIYSDGRPLYVDPRPHYACVALVLPPDYRVRRVGYLIVGHQVGTRDPRPGQTEPIATLLSSLRETPGA